MFSAPKIAIFLLSTIVSIKTCIVIPNNQKQLSILKYEKNKKIDDQRKAYHEAGHTLVAYLLDFPITKATIESTPNGYYMGYVDFRIKRNSSNENIIKVFLAGYVAEELLFGGAIPEMIGDDLENVFNYLENSTSNQELLSQYIEQTKDLMSKNFELLEVLATALQQQKTLMRNDIQTIIYAFLNKPKS